MTDQAANDRSARTSPSPAESPAGSSRRASSDITRIEEEEAAKQARWTAWRRENAASLNWYRDLVDEHGILLEEFRDP
ncbi:MAG: type II toxin-antitoxin system CcdA family antitoxin [Pseudomonadota bacterium]